MLRIFLLFHHDVKAKQVKLTLMKMKIVLIYLTRIHVVKTP